ncbi:MAG: hypothetical protein N2C14_02290, partial [Planctomycetales bacterium]
MRQRTMVSTAAVGMLFAVLLSVNSSSPFASAQEDAKKTPATKKGQASEKADGKTNGAAKPRGRLPWYYRQVV